MDMLQPPLRPMLLTTREEPFDSEEYLFEIKWDGYRCISFINGSTLFLQSRNGKSLNRNFPELAEIHKALNCKEAILDGEICYIDKEGKANFGKLQEQFREKKSPYNNSIKLIAWDILSYDNKDIYHLPLLERKEILKEMVREERGILIPGYIINHGRKLYEEAEKNKLEGIVAKKLNSPYEFKRSKYWYKIKCWQYTEVYIGGYTAEGTALLVGKYEKGNLHYMGKVKMALDKNMTQALFRFLPTILTASCPFRTEPAQKGVKWVKPLLRSIVRYTEISRHNTFRHAYAIKIILDNSGED